MSRKYTSLHVLHVEIKIENARIHPAEVVHNDIYYSDLSEWRLTGRMEFKSPAVKCGDAFKALGIPRGKKVSPGRIFNRIC